MQTIHFYIEFDYEKPIEFNETLFKFKLLEKETSISNANDIIDNIKYVDIPEHHKRKVFYLTVTLYNIILKNNPMYDIFYNFLQSVNYIDYYIYLDTTHENPIVYFKENNNGFIICKDNSGESFAKYVENYKSFNSYKTELTFRQFVNLN